MKGFVVSISAKELGRLLRRAIPLATIQMLLQLTGHVDLIYAAQHSMTMLSGVGLANALFWAIAALSFTCGFGVEPFLAQGKGAQDHARCTFWLWQGIVLATLFSIPLSLFAYGLSKAIWWADIDPLMYTYSHEFFLGRILGLWPCCVLGVLRSFVQISGWLHTLLWTGVLINVLNFVLDPLLLWGDSWLLAYGLPALGFPALGAFGLGLASSIALWVQVLCLLVVTASKGFFKQLPAIDWGCLMRAMALGLPASLHILAEIFIFSLVGLLAARMGSVQMAGHQAALGLCSLSYGICLGLGTATSVEVGKCIGAKDTEQARRIGGYGILLASVWMAFSAGMMAYYPDILLRWYHLEPASYQMACALLLIGAVFQWMDGLQAIGTASLRGMGSTVYPFGVVLVSYWLVALPIGLWLAYGLGMELQGLWWGLAIGLTCAAAAILQHFLRLTNRPILPLEQSQLHPTEPSCSS